MATKGWNEEAERRAREWLAKHDTKAPAKSPRLKRWERRKTARRQQQALERRALAKPLLKGVE